MPPHWMFFKSTETTTASSFPCEERERLVLLYLASINRHAELSKTAPRVNTQRWRLATEGSRAECSDALYDLSEHRKEHGC
jgi:hypothetical protein